MMADWTMTGGYGKLKEEAQQREEGEFERRGSVVHLNLPMRQRTERIRTKPT